MSDNNDRLDPSTDHALLKAQQLLAQFNSTRETRAKDIRTAFESGKPSAALLTAQAVEFCRRLRDVHTSIHEKSETLREFVESSEPGEVQDCIVLLQLYDNIQPLLSDALTEQDSLVSELRSRYDQLEVK